MNTNGRVVAWGYNSDGQCTVPLAAQTCVVAVAAGWNYSLALKADGRVVAWGDNYYGQCSVPAERLWCSLAPVRALLLGY